MSSSAVQDRTSRQRARGERCCDRDLRSSLSAAEARAITRDLEVLAHPVRLQLLEVLLRKQGRVCVCDLEAAVPVKQPTVSHHLKLLREAGLVGSEREGVWAFYFVRREALEAWRSRVAAALRWFE
ncbi:MAG TPA: metalloregulator ArsR/SmtB family transcription factor [Gemmatimonadales bacterium]|nr:metalloregulator ArsR/SmtB family transcription factor [Gemmatimonadales bacterium]